jgi:4'-phosphopantetheinyl transferase
LIAITKNEAHIWWATTDSIKYTALLGLLSTTEQKKTKTFHFTKDRCIYALAHALLRQILSEYLDKSPHYWNFTYNQYGRPEIAYGGENIRFNISHTQGLVACIITNNHDCGVDVEALKRVEEPLKLAQRFFSQIESEALALGSKNTLQQRFIRYWTLKEAYIKAKGMGLSLSLQQFSFIFQGKNISINFTAELKDNPLHWQFTQFIPTIGYCLAAAICYTNPHPPHCIDRRVNPLHVTLQSRSTNLLSTLQQTINPMDTDYV